MTCFLWTHRLLMVIFCGTLAMGTILTIGCGTAHNTFLDPHLDLQLQDFTGTGATVPTQPIQTHIPANPQGRP